MSSLRGGQQTLKLLLSVVKGACFMHFLYKCDNNFVNVIDGLRSLLIDLFEKKYEKGSGATLYAK